MMGGVNLIPSKAIKGVFFVPTNVFSLFKLFLPNIFFSKLPLFTIT